MATRSNYDTRMQLQAVSESSEGQAAALVVYQLYTLLRAALMYSPGHPQVTASAKRFVDATRPYYETFGTKELLIVIAGAHIFVNRQQVRAEAAEFARAQWLVQRLAKVGIVEIGLRHDMVPEELAEFARRFSVATNDDAEFVDLVELPGISVLRARIQPEFEALLRQLVRLERYPLLQLYAEGMARAREFSRSLVHGHRPDDVAARRLVAQIIDGLKVDRSGLLGLTQLCPLRNTFGNRRFDGTVLATALALELGLTDLEALELGTATLLRPLPAKWGPWWERTGRSPEEARGVAASAVGRIERILAYEGPAPHGLQLPASWYGTRRPPHPATRIVVVAEAWVDLMQPGRSASPFLADIAMQLMLARAGVDFDPVVVRALLSMLGMYAPGSIVVLNSRDAAIVVQSPPAGADPRRPTVRPLAGPTNQVYALARPELAAYHIINVLPPHAAGTNPWTTFLQ